MGILGVIMQLEGVLQDLGGLRGLDEIILTRTYQNMDTLDMEVKISAKKKSAKDIACTHRIKTQIRPVYTFHKISIEEKLQIILLLVQQKPLKRRILTHEKIWEIWQFEAMEPYVKARPVAKKNKAYS